MTKQFIFNEDSDWWTVSDNITKKERLWGQDVVELLNELNNENEKLKKENKRLKHDLNNIEKELQEYKDFMSLG